MNTVQQLVNNLELVVESKLSQHKRQLPRGKTKEVIKATLMAASQEKWGKIQDQQSIEAAIYWAVKNNSPVNISLFYAIEAHARSRFKILNWRYNVPRFGDIWAMHWFNLLDQKVKAVYSPGLNIVIVDESKISCLMGWSHNNMNLRKSIVRGLVPSTMQLSIVDTPSLALGKETPLVDPRQVLAVLTSTQFLDEEQQKVIASSLYTTKEPDWSNIQSQVVPNIWNKASFIAQQMVLHSSARKDADWVRTSVFHGQPYIDGCILRKGRWSPNVWDRAAPQHGGAVPVTDFLDNPEGKKVVEIIPESMLELEGRIPHKAPVKDFQSFTDIPIPWDGEVELYWK